MAASCGKEYFWVLCDDDKYDFSNWNEVESAIASNVDIICLADYIFPNQYAKKDIAYQIFQLTFVPAGIYKSSIINNDILITMYESTFTMFQQSVPTIYIVNKNGTIKVLSKPIVFNGLHFKDKTEDIAFTRGIKEEFF